MNAVAVHKLASVFLRADNARLLDMLPDTGLSTPALLRHLDNSRHERTTALGTAPGI